MLFVPPTVQDPAFHNFADGREIASISDFRLVIGTAGLWMSVNSRPKNVLTNIGSAYYHLNVSSC